MTCPHCDAESRPGRFCTRCGRRLPPSPDRFPTVRLPARPSRRGVGPKGPARPTVDQRGVKRGAKPDIGAFEVAGKG